MPFVPAVCPNCGGILTVENTNDAAICQFCGTPYIVEKAISLYQNSTNLYANTVNITGEKEFVIRAGELVRYNGADIDVVVPDGVLVIGKAFQNMPYLRAIYLPDSVVEISASAFLGCENLQEVHMTQSLRKVGSGAFRDCKKIKLYGVSSNCSFEQKYVCPVCGYMHEGVPINSFKCPSCGVDGNKFLPYLP